VCCIERTGSNLLTTALHQTKVAGRPLEYFNPVEQDKPWIRAILGESDMVGGFPKILLAGSTPNGMFGVKAHWAHFRLLGLAVKGEWSESQRVAMYELLRAQVPALLSPEAANELLRSKFSDMSQASAAYSLFQSQLPDLRLIWLRRENMVARAISHFRAKLTGVWHQAGSSSNSAPAKRIPDSALEFDLHEIHRFYCLGAFQEKSWQQFFKENNITPHCVVYEELETNYESTVRGVFEFLGIDSSKTPVPKPSLLKQSDALSEDWEQRYRKLIQEAAI